MGVDTAFTFLANNALLRALGSPHKLMILNEIFGVVTSVMALIVGLAGIFAGAIAGRRFRN